MKDFRNELLRRREVKLIINEDSNPGIQKSIKMIAEQFKTSEELIAIKTLKSKFGRNTFLIDAFIYDSAKDKERIEPRKRVKKENKEGAK